MLIMDFIPVIFFGMQLTTTWNSKEFKNNIKLYVNFINKFSLKSETCI